MCWFSHYIESCVLFCFFKFLFYASYKQSIVTTYHYLIKVYSKRPQVDFLPHWGTNWELLKFLCSSNTHSFSAKGCSSAACFDSSDSSDTYWEKETPVEQISLTEVTGLPNPFSICNNWVISNMYKKSLEIINIFQGPAVQFYMSGANVWMQCLAMGLPSSTTGRWQRASTACRNYLSCVFSEVKNSAVKG